MKITVSYLSSKFDSRTTVKKINECPKADAIHADLADGKYVPAVNFDIKELPKLFAGIDKPIDFHLMTEEPEQYLDTLLKMNVNIVFFHPSTTKDPYEFIDQVKNEDKKVGVVINPGEDIKDFIPYLGLIDAILIMSVVPGKGGQPFLKDVLVNYELIREQKRYHLFDLYVDGGINEDTIEFVKTADGIISGSYICKSDDYEEQINKLKYKVEQDSYIKKRIKTEE